MSDTPRTDAAVFLSGGKGFNSVCPNFARQLERENESLRLLCADYDYQRDEVLRLQAEIERWRDSNNRLRAEMEHQARMNQELREDKARMDWLATEEGSNWAGVHAGIDLEDITRDAIDEAMEGNK